jgi:hypothetical protein
LSRSRERIDRRGLLAARTHEGDRLLEAPVFILSSVRSGSTLLRVMLNSHSQIHAPHELHLMGVRTRFTSRHARAAMAELGLSPEQLEFLLWDRIMHRELVQHGKRIIVEKTPSSAMMWRKIKRAWPDARFIFLLRHPGAVTESWDRARPRRTRETVIAEVTRYLTAVDRARSRNDGLTVRYEDVTADPEREMRRICEFLGIDFEPAMLDYGTKQHGDFAMGLGDWSSRIRTGKVQPAKPPPPVDAIPEALVPIARRWGYVD